LLISQFLLARRRVYGYKIIDVDFWQSNVDRINMRFREEDGMKASRTRLTSAQVAARLRIKPATLYAYVSRGLLSSERAEKGGSTFDPLDVEAFAVSRRKGSRPAGGTVGRPIMVLDSDLTLIQDDELYFRGKSATGLARRLQFEDGVRLLWVTPNSNNDIDDRFVSRPDVVKAIRKASSALGNAPRFMDRLKLAVLIVGSSDPVRDSLGQAAVRDAGRQILSTMVDSLPALQTGPRLSAPIATRLWSKVSPLESSTGNLRLLNATMILCMDHDLAISTMSARVAASARTDPYAAVIAALSTLDGAMHGAASIAAVDMLTETMVTGKPERAISAQIARFQIIPGFGHIVYKKVDPRAEFLFKAMRELSEYGEALSAADQLSAVVHSRSPRPANLDLALAVLVVGAKMQADAGELIFAVSRTAGWVSHVLDEYAQTAMRLRPESRYTGIRPSPR
jgi:citrate synthase